MFLVHVDSDLVSQRHDQLRHLFYALQDKDLPTGLGAGFPPVVRDGDMEVDDENLTDLAAFVKQHDGEAR